MRKRRVAQPELVQSGNLDLYLSSDIKEIMSALQQIQEKAHKDGLKKNEDTISICIGAGSVEKAQFGFESRSLCKVALSKVRLSMGTMQGCGQRLLPPSSSLTSNVNIEKYGLPMPIALLREDNNLPPQPSKLKEYMQITNGLLQADGRKRKGTQKRPKF